MKKKVLLLILCIILVFCVFAVWQEIKNSPSFIIRQVFLENQILTIPKKTVYKMSYFGILPIGRAEISVKEELFKGKKQIYHLYAEGRPAYLSSFFKASVKVESFVDRERLYPYRYTQVLIIPDKNPDIKEVIYDQENNVMELEGVKRKILPDTQDHLSAIFFIQHQPLYVGKEFDININTNQKNYRLYGRVISRHEYQLGARRIGVWFLQGDIRRRDKVQRHNQKIQIWLLDNNDKTLLLTRAITNAGIYSASLIHAE